MGWTPCIVKRGPGPQFQGHLPGKWTETGYLASERPGRSGQWVSSWPGQLLCLICQWVLTISSTEPPRVPYLKTDQTQSLISVMDARLTFARPGRSGTCGGGHINPSDGLQSWDHSNGQLSDSYSWDQDMGCLFTRTQGLKKINDRSDRSCHTMGMDDRSDRSS